MINRMHSEGLNEQQRRLKPQFAGMLKAFAAAPAATRA